MSNATHAAHAPVAYDLKARYALGRSVAALARELPLPPADSISCGEEVLVALGGVPAGAGHGATLRQVRVALFAGPGREAELTLDWHESLATAAFAGAFAALQPGLDAAHAAVAGLLHRAGEIAARRALALAESASGIQLCAHAHAQIVREHAPAFLDALVRAWRLAPDVAVAVSGWSRFGEFPLRTLATAVFVGDLLAHELLHPGRSAPGMLESAFREQGATEADLRALRAQAPAVQALIGRLG